MKSHFTSRFFSGNRRRLLQEIGENTVVVIGANGVLQRSADTTYDFSQDRNFWYFTGIDEPDLLLCILEGKSYIILPPANATHDIFNGAINQSAIQKSSGVTDVLPYQDGWKLLETHLRTARTVHTFEPAPLYARGYRMYTNPAKRRLVAKLKRVARNAKYIDLRPITARFRMIKQEPELAAIREAVAITTHTLDSVRSSAFLTQTATEYGLESAITAQFRASGATGHAYSPIVACGDHATTLHYVENTDVLRPDKLIVLDVGAEVEYYAADITRTISMSKPTPRQQAVYDAVLDVQQTAVAMLRPDVSLESYEEAVCKHIGKKLVGLGLISDANDTSQVRAYYPHAASHFVGLDVHDQGEYSQPLQAGIVITCEPGIYIPEEGIGVRIEDDILITPTGNENISQHCSYDCYSI